MLHTLLSRASGGKQINAIIAQNFRNRPLRNVLGLTLKSSEGRGGGGVIESGKDKKREGE